MSRCELTGKKPTVKNLVSHSNIKTKSRSMANIQLKRIYSPTLKEFIRLRVSTSAIRDMEHSGGFDQFILNLNEASLSKRATTAKNRIRRKLRGSSGDAAKGAVKEQA